MTGRNEADGERGPEELREEVRASLSGRQKELSPKFFYDARGSELFEEITRLPEYYLTRTERSLLERHVPAWVAEHRPGTLVELGAGSARKSEIILRAMGRKDANRRYVPVDVSGDFLEAAARRLEEEHPGLRVSPVVADITDPLELPSDLPGPILFALLGSTLGNFPDEAATSLLDHLVAEMAPDDLFLMGADLRASESKPVELLEAAYNDAQGVTADFNRNALRVLNRRLGADFDPGAFEHRAFYDAERGQMEMHLVSLRDQVIRIPGLDPISLREGETIRTEVSAKYDRPTVEELFRGVGLEVARWVEDPRSRYALVLGRLER